MSKLKIGILASIGGLLMISALLAVILAVAYAATDSPWCLLYALLAVPAAMGARYLFWVTEYRS